MWWLIALRGLRRGEAAGLRWVDVDLDQRVVMIDQQRIALGHTVTVGPPKTRASQRTVALDRTTVGQPACPSASPTCRTRCGRRGVARHRLRIHHRRRQPAAPGLDHPPIPPPGRRLRPATGAAARPAPRRGHPRAQRRCRSEDRAGTARAHQHRADRRHLHQRASRPALQDGRGHRPAGPHRGGPQPRPPTSPKDRPAEIRSSRPTHRPGTGTPQAIPPNQTRQEGPRTRDTHTTPNDQSHIARRLYDLVTAGAPPGTRTANPRIKSGPMTSLVPSIPSSAGVFAASEHTGSTQPDPSPNRSCAVSGQGRSLVRETRSLQTSRLCRIADNGSRSRGLPVTVEQTTVIRRVWCRPCATLGRVEPAWFNRDPCVGLMRESVIQRSSLRSVSLNPCSAGRKLARVDHGPI